jgi:chaperonin cofactor prefoldin
VYIGQLVMERNVTRDSVLALILEKEKIEAEINHMKSVLDGVSSVHSLFIFHISIYR